MKKMNKLVALLLAAVMVLGLFPTMTAHTHATEYHTHGIEEYPAIALDTPTTVDITEGGATAYFTFTPEVTDLYHFYSSSDTNPWIDTEGYIYDAEMNQLVYNDQIGYGTEYGNPLGESSSNFCCSYVMTAGETYVLAAKFYGGSGTGTFNVTIFNGHNSTGVVTKEATCTEDGVMTYTCSYCGAIYEEAIPAAHIWDEENGVCTRCGEVYLISGTCGDALTWTLDWDGKLTISGTGAMDDFTQDGTDTVAPWNSLTEAQNPAFITVKSAVVEDGVTTIGDNAFYNCYEMESISLPETVTSIGDYGFSNTGIQEIIIPEAVTELGVYAFQWCGSLAKVEMPDNLTTIPEGTFNGCGKLTSIGWPANLTTICNSAFCYVEMEELALPEGLTTIEQFAFRYSYMSTVILPSTLTTLGEQAFGNCWDLRTIAFNGNAPTIASSAFRYVEATVYYPENNATWNADTMVDYGGTLTWKAACADHAYGEVVSIDATCTVGAYKTRTCSVCGWVDNSPKGEPLGHDYQYSVVEPDCGNWQYGYDLISCSRCDYEMRDNWVPYEHDYVTTVVEATCTEDGYTTYTCTKCGDTYNDNYVYAAGHQLGEWSEPTEATCTEASVKTATCTVCNETVTEEVSPALGHSWDEKNPVANEDGSVTYTCTACGETYRTEGTRLYLGDNAFSLAAKTPAGSKTYTAENVGTLTITVSDLRFLNTWNNVWTPIAIDWVFSNQMLSVAINGTTADYTVEGSETAAKIIMTTEVNSGDVLTVTLNHDEANSAYYDKAIQVNMNLDLEVDEPIDPNDPWGKSKWTKIDVDTETEDPSGTGTEGEFEYSWDNNENTIWHSDWKNGKDVLTGENTISGSINFNKAYTINQFSFLPRQDYTYWEDGSGVVLQASLYKGTLNDDGTYTWEPLAEHVEFEHNQEKKTICFDTQEVQFVKFVAEKSSYMDQNEGWVAVAEFDINYEEPAAHEHSYEAVVTAPTCTEGGYTTYTCACGDSYVADETEALGHDYDIVVTDPTCTTDGFSTYTCTRCDDSFVDDTKPALGHNEEILPGKDATCTEDGLTEGKKCTVCGETTVAQEVIPALGHNHVNGKCSVCGDLLTGTFEDVLAGSFCFDAVEWAAEKGITNGISATIFDPNGELKRSQVVTMLWRAAGSPEPTTTEHPFTDVAEGSFYYKAMLWAVENNITKGVSATEFAPDGITTRGQAVTFLWRAEGMPEPETTENPFPDVKEGSFCYKAVLWAVESGITTGMSAGHFGTGNQCNRGQMVTFLYRTAQLPETEEPEVVGEKYLVLLKAIGNGTIVCNVNEAAAGEKVTFTAIPEEGYALTQFKIFDPNGEIDLSTFSLAEGENENEYVFTMIAHDLIVDCVFEVYP